MRQARIGLAVFVGIVALASAESQSSVLFLEASVPKSQVPVGPAPSDNPSATPSGNDSDLPPSAESALETIHKEFMDQLRLGKFQWANALTALILGAVMVFDGRFAFKWIVIFCFGFFAYTISRAELSTRLGDLLAPPVQVIAAVEIALAVAFVSWNGFEGVKYVFGMVLGFSLGNSFSAFGRLHGFDAFNNSTFIVVEYTILVAGFMCLIGLEKSHQKIMAFVMSFIGGSFIAASLGYFTCLTLWASQKNSFTTVVGAEMWPYIDIVQLLWGQGVPEGLIGDVTYRVLGTLLWMLFSALGFYVQLRSAKKAQKSSGKESKDVEGKKTSSFSWGRRALRTADASEPLLA